ncbi:MAG TPA: oligosaccharide flippase family protein [Blastocatellia bacterium]|nr:oligosaccharide flippase family protein [Blastocatellia bacterium]
MTKVPTQKSFMERAAWLTGANLLAFALSFITPLVIVRVFDREEFGTYKQLFQILTTFLTALYLHVPMSAYYFMPREPNKRLQVAMNIILFYLATGGLTALIFAAYPTWITYIFHNPALNEHIPLLGVALTLWLIATNVEIFPLALGDVRTASRFIVLTQISKSLIMISAALMFGSLRAVLWGSIVQGAIQCAFMLGYIHYRIGSLKVRLDQLFDWQLLRKQLANSLPYGGGATAQSLQVDMHNYFVSHYFSAASFAVYSNGCFQVPLVSLLQSSFRDALTPEVARLEASGDYRAIIQAWLNAMRRLSFVILPACALLFVVRRELIVTLFTEAYADSAQVFAIYLTVLMTQTVLTSSIMRSIADFRYFRLKFNLAQLPLTCVALYIGVKLGGLAGAAAATACISVLDVAVGVTAICRKLGVKRKDLRQLAPVANAAPAIIVAMIASYAVRTLITPAHSIIILGACSIIFAFIYIVGALLFGALTPEDKDAIYKQAQRLSRKFTSEEISKPARIEDGGSRIADCGLEVDALSRAGGDTIRVGFSEPINPQSAIRNPQSEDTRPSALDFSPECKARAVLQVLKDQGSVARICGELQIDEGLLSSWKEQFTKQAGSIFEKEQAAADANERVAELERLVGRLRRELESERIAELERLVGRLMLELEESKREPAILGAPVRRNGKHEWDL